MSFHLSDLAHIKWSLLAFTVSLIIGASAVWLSAKYVGHSLRERQAAQKQVAEARKKLGAAESDLENMSTYAMEYAYLEQNKTIGGEQRLDWMEGLEKLRQQHHAIDFRYTITPQQPYTPNPALEMGNFELNLSGLNLQVDLLHEGQLIKLFAALRTEMNSWFIIDHCTLRRNGNTDETASYLTPRLKAECTGGWLTMKNRNAP